MSSDIKFSHRNNNSASDICEMHLWSPLQGTRWSAIPLLIDLDFTFEETIVGGCRVMVFAKRGVIHLSVSGFDIIRGSKLGEHTHKQYEISEAQKSVSDLVVSENIQEFKGGFSLVAGFFGKAVAIFRKNRRRQSESDKVIKVQSKHFRVAPSTKNRWYVSEPAEPGYLKGRYIGKASDIDPEPLCLLSMTKSRGVAEVTITIDTDFLSVSVMEADSFKSAVSATKRAVITQLIRRGISTGTLNALPQARHSGAKEVILSFSNLTAERCDD